MLNKLLRLDKSLFSLDVETSGTQPEIDRIIQIALTQHHPTKDPIAWSSYVNPGIPILNTVSGGHGITDADVADAPTFAALASLLASRLLNVDIIGFWVEFDIAFMRAEMLRANVEWPWNGYAIDACLIYRKKRPHSLSNAYKAFVNEAGFTDAHNAANDVLATDAVLEGMLNMYQDLPRTVKELSEFCYPVSSDAVDREAKFIFDAAGDIICNFGGAKGHRGKRLREMPESYLRWMLGASFPPDVKKLVEDALNGVYRSRI